MHIFEKFCIFLNMIFNHQDSSLSSVFFHMAVNFKCLRIVLPCLKAEESLFLNYGKLQNDFLLLDYGFVIRSNPFDTVQLRFDVGMIELGRSIGGLSKTNIGKGTLLSLHI